MKGLRLTKGTDGFYDLKLEDGKFLFTEDGTQAAQHALFRLSIFRGEWFRNVLDGTQWYQIIFDASKEQSEKELEIKRRILDADTIQRILTFEWSQVGNSVTITGSVLTLWGEESLALEFSAL